jgi:twitching motility protein PilT
MPTPRIPPPAAPPVVAAEIPAVSIPNFEQREQLAELQRTDDPALGLDLDSTTPEPRTGIPLAPPPALEPVPKAAPPSAAAPSVSAPIAAAYIPSSAAPADVQRLHALLAEGVRRGASDVHLHATMPPMLRLHGTLAPLEGHAPLSPAETERLAQAALSDGQRTHFFAKHDLDFPYFARGLGRFRANAYRQQRGIDLVFRVIPLEVPSLKSLGLPESLAKLTSFHQGLILCTGPAGCGKSTTMAALLDIINRERSDHILTIEDPIEFIHPSRKCLVRQRQVVSHTESFARALRAALREDPDVIAIGEMRDLETIALALSAAETGHLVLGTLHTNSAVRTINRVLDVFPPDQQAQVRVMFASSLRAVISQKLVRRADGTGRVPALEVLTVIPAVSNLIRDEAQFQIKNIMQTNRALGMRLLDDSLKELVASGMITMQEARANADLPGSFG